MIRSSLTFGARRTFWNDLTFQAIPISSSDQTFILSENQVQKAVRKNILEINSPQYSRLGRNFLGGFLGRGAPWVALSVFTRLVQTERTTHGPPPRPQKSSQNQILPKILPFQNPPKLKSSHHIFASEQSCRLIVIPEKGVQDFRKRRLT